MPKETMDIERWAHPKILYIEDDKFSKKLIKRLLETNDYIVLEASDGLSGIKIAEEELPDLILMDMNIPGLDGYEATTRIKSIENLRATPIIALTASVRLGDKERSLVAGCDGYLQKPIDVDKFPHQIAEFLKGKREQVAREERDEYLKQYSEKLVARLHEKVEELISVNEELKVSNRLLDESRTRLMSYNQKLLHLSQMTNRILQTANTTQDLIEIVPSMICQMLDFDRCILFSMNPDGANLELASSAGFDELPKNLSISINNNTILKIILKNISVNIKNIERINDKEFIGLVTKLKSESFFITPLTGKISIRYWGKYDSNIKGLIFVDNFYSKRRIEPYDWRILRTFGQTVGLAYENLRLNQKLRDMYRTAEEHALTDGLTGLYNYRFFKRQMVREYHRAQRHNTTFSLAILDVDFFKNYNDTHGHPAGDEVLKVIANILRNCTRRTDIVARYGGEEFCVILPETPKSSAISMAEKIREKVYETDFPKQETQPNGHLSVSIGVATFPDDAEKVELLIEKADESLYQAKRSGRNRVISSQEEILSL
jgi:diguanylate cyclase (GGDEF)-like protein